MAQEPIIVFDSGIGGLSIYRPLRIALPKENILYVADAQNFPYGHKSSNWIATRLKALAHQWVSLSPKAVVLACNSATTTSLEEVRSMLNCPVVGVEPVIKPLSMYARPLALMTKASADSVTTKQLLEKYGPHVQIYTPEGLAAAIEFNNYDQVKRSIHKIKEIVQKHDNDAIGLSCTHYSLIKEQLKQAMGGLPIIDPSQAVVNQVLKVLR